MRKERLFLLTILIPLAIFTILTSNKLSGKQISTIFTSPTPYPTIISSDRNSEQDLAITPSSSRNIEVLSPLSGDMVKSKLDIKGNARVFEGVVSIRLLDSQENILVQTTTQANAPDAGFFGPFSQIIDFQTTDATGTLEAYQVSTKDGSEIDKVTIPLQFN